MPRDLSPSNQLILFKTRVEELRNTRLLRKGFKPGITLEYDKMRGLRFESREPEEDDLRSFLVTFRQFTSEREPIFMNKIYNVCHQYLTNDELKRYLIESRDLWKRIHRSAGIRLELNGRELTPEYVMDLWINALFHADAEKIRIIKSLLPHEFFFVRFHFLDFLVEATRHVLYVGNIVTVALKEGLVRG